jgi:hypothetical protein
MNASAQPQVWLHCPPAMKLLHPDAVLQRPFITVDLSPDALLNCPFDTVD